MKSLRQSLIDYEIGLLQAIAGCRAITLTSIDKTEIIDQLVEAMLSPVAIAIALADLLPEQNDALQFLLASGGQTESARFTRQFGPIRLMGSARLKRERPWENPINPAEGLWYRGFIYKSFQISGQELVYIPVDMVPLIPSNTPQEQSPETTQTVKIETTSEPSNIIDSGNRLRENFFNLLVYLQTHSVKLNNKTRLSPKESQKLASCLLPPLLPQTSETTELDFLLHLGLRANLLSEVHGQLRPNRETTRSWLQSSAAQQALHLQNAWRADPTWNDLWHVPQLVPQPTGWENSPLRARSKILGYLENVPADQWLSLESFVTFIKQVDPDFQRPNGDYETWYIQDAQGKSLMGFKHWDQVEGALIRYMLTCVLPFLSAVNLGGPANSPTAFRLTSSGQAFLAGRPEKIEPPKRPLYLRVDDKFQVRVPIQASLYDRFQLARFAELYQRESNRTMYKITQASMSKALRNGVTHEQITAFLTRSTNNQIPLKVVESLRNWGTRYGTVKLENATLIRLQDGRLIAELQKDPTLGPLLGNVLGPTTILVPSKNVPDVRRALKELGYLTDE